MAKRLRPRHRLPSLRSASKRQIQLAALKLRRFKRLGHPALGHNTWLDEHILKFIAPRIDGLDKLTAPKDTDGAHYWKPAILNTLLEVWEDAKAVSKGRTMLLAGRDTWELEILARLENFPTIFRPDISMNSYKSVKDDYTKCHLIDSGHRGTIPMQLGIKHFHLVYCSRTLSDGWKEHALCQHHGRNSLAGPPYNLYCSMESSPKYWYSGHVVNARIRQELHADNVFLMAAKITVHIAMYALETWAAQRRTR